ncbi:hypothetical protein P691DRAFT_768182 [Macrolepiota fuliginosa MF-IS2]|uniref:CsbD-like domain-containing protein n=1 Tax=Macrolepiota fuliginosa MF-IS2 TaxID=1400762 RepID=A0A9P6BW37_9AGAR|nr:hypothetical protein P691DRAFT_768182 [Macrolepiota fuliginosa MF-IS2]
MSNDPSKISGQFHSTKGGLKSGLGDVTRSTNLQSSGGQERAQGQAEYAAARGQEGYLQNPQEWGGGGNTADSATQDYSNQGSNQGHNKDTQGWSGAEKRESAVLGSDQGLQGGQVPGTRATRQDFKDASQRDTNRDEFT